MKAILILVLLLSLLAPLSSCQDRVEIEGNADVDVAPDTEPDVTIVDDETDVVAVPDSEPDVVVSEPADRNQVNIPGFEVVFAAAGLLAALRAMRRRA